MFASRTFAGKRLNISEQEYTDCVYTYDGCKGGWEYAALEYSKKHDRAGLNTEIPYKANSNLECKNGDMYAAKTNALIQAGVRVKVVAGAKMIENRQAFANEILLKILSKRVVAVGVYVGPDFKPYATGIFNTKYCKYRANHAVAAVGYGMTGNK